MVELSGHCGDCRRQAGTLEERSICSKLHHCNLVDCGLGHIFLLDLQPILIDFLTQFCLWPQTWLSSPRDHLV